MDNGSRISCLNVMFYTSGAFSIDSPTSTLRINLNERMIVQRKPRVDIIILKRTVLREERDNSHITPLIN
jgi:hypothetical protein